jgi:uncharacterized membrane protein YjgN (DUF898 family)
VSQPLVSAPAAPPEASWLRFQFHGTASEYFRIWIVNLCLTVVTLGLYAPWAKVRTRRYFAGNLAIGDSAFDYDADPVRILIGRLILFAALGAYALADLVSDKLSFALGVAGFFLFPAAAVRSTAFHHRHTLLRGIRFRFAAPYAEAFFVLIVAPLLATLTLGLVLPWLHGRRQQFVVRHSAYGTSGFEFEWSARPYYRLFTSAALPTLAAIAFATCGVGALDETRWSGRSGASLVIGLALPALVALAMSVAIIQAGLTNLLYRNARIGDLRIRSELRAASLAWLYATSGLAIVLSLGLATPWARVRLARLRADSLSLAAPTGLDAFAQASEPEAGLGALASETADLFDFDLGL